MLNRSTNKLKIRVGYQIVTLIKKLFLAQRHQMCTQYAQHTQQEWSSVMTDVLGYKGVWGVLAPSTNTVVEPDFYRMGVPGITAHVGRIHIRTRRYPRN